MAQHAVVALTEIAASPGATLDAASLSRALGKALKTPFEKQQEKKAGTGEKKFMQFVMQDQKDEFEMQQKNFLMEG